MIVFGGGSTGSIVKLRCPSCGEVQTRARAPKGTRYRCRKCHHGFTAESAAAAKPPRPSKPHRT